MVGSQDMNNGNLLGRSMFETKDWTDAELGRLLETARKLEALDGKGIATPLLQNKLAQALFFDQSTRTKTSWLGAATRLGMMASVIDGSTTQVSHGETPEETGAMIGMNAHAIGIRHDKILGEGNTFMRRAEKGANTYLEGRKVPFVNLQCDIDHPTQSLADLMKLQEHFGKKDGFSGKKFVISWAYSPSYAKPLSVPQGLITLMTRFGMDVVLAHPEGYELLPETLKTAKTFSGKSKGTFTVTHGMTEAVKDADIVYAKSWGPMELMRERIQLDKSRDQKGLVELEKRMLSLNASHKDWIYDEAKARTTRNAKYMHCLPADIGAEVSQGVFEANKDFVYSEANKKVYVIEALLALSLVPSLDSRLEALAR